MKKISKRGSRIILVLMAIVILISMYTFTSNISVNAQTNSTFSKNSEQAINSVYRYMIKYGYSFYIRSDNQIISYNVKTKKKKILTNKIKSKWGSMLLCNGYIYYSDYVNSVDCIYRVDINGRRTPQLLCRNGNLGFYYKNRIYYGNKGLCSMSLNGTNKRRHTTSANASNMFVFYYNKRFFYGNMLEQYSVNTQYTKKLKSKNPYANVVHGLNYTDSASSVEMKNGQCWVDKEKKTGNWNTVVYSIKYGKTQVNKEIYKSKKQKVKIEASSDKGYLLISEANNTVSWNDMYKKGSLKIIDTKGRIVATIR